MPAAGDTIVVPTVPGSRVATVEQTSDSVGFTTTETVVMSIIVPLVTGRVYRVRFIGSFANSDVGSNTAQVHLRQDTVAGTQMQRVLVTAPTTGFGWNLVAEVEFTASATANKTFVVTGTRVTGSQTMRLEADATRPAYLYVDYIRG